MKYKFQTEKEDYSDFASGKIIYSIPGTTAFPIRLASEIFLRGKELLNERGIDRTLVIYDPCCGGGYLLTVLGFLFSGDIDMIYGSDIDHNVLGLAQKNLALLTEEGIKNRISELENLYESYTKESHHDALTQAKKLHSSMEKDIPSHLFAVDIINSNVNIADDLIPGKKVDFVVTDLPYGKLVNWNSSKEEHISKDVANANDFNETKEANGTNEVNENVNSANVISMLSNIRPILSVNSIVAIVTNSKIKEIPQSYRRHSKFKIGKRYVFLFQFVDEM